MNKLVSMIVSIPLAGMIIVFSLVNRDPVTLDFWPLTLTASIPVFAIILISLMIGVLWGGLAAWLAAMRPVDEGHDVFWVGIAAPEQVLLADLRKALIQVDVSDVAVALAGSALLLLLFWRLGGFRAGGEEVQEPPSVRLHRYINQGEGSSVEFKSTVRTNLRAGKRGKEIELAWLKAVVAFLNSKGGTLLIGVDDGGRIVGIEADGFENQDRCHLHLKNLINQHIGAEYSSFIQISLVDVDGSTVVLMECQPANGPVFLRIGKNEEFYIRSGPSSVKLSPSQMISYVLQNMKS